MNKSRIVLISTLMGLFLLVIASGCSTISLDNPYETEYDPSYGLDKGDIFAHFNLHRGRWWNHYARGKWLLAGGYYGAARSDFTAAMKERFEDKSDARTYGMHFRDYFPHRESGIAFYLQGEGELNFADKEELFKKAIDELQKSIRHEASSRAKFYLRLATAGYWSATQADITEPVLGIANSSIDRWADIPTLYTNRYDPQVDKYIAAIDVRASDHQSGIATVSINDQELFIESVERDFSETGIVYIDPLVKAKDVEVKSVDLAGNPSSPVNVRIVVDTTAPTAAINVNPDNRPLLSGHIPIEIDVEDDKALNSVQVGVNRFENRDCRGQTKWKGTFYVEPDSLQLTIKVTDLAGNETTNTITLNHEEVVSSYTAYLPSERISFDYDFGHWDEIFPGRSLSSTRLPRVSRAFSTKTKNTLTTIGQVGTPMLASLQTRPPVSMLVLRDFQDSNSVLTSQDQYFLRGEIRNAYGPTTVIIMIDDKSPKSISTADRGDHFIFSDSISLPNIGKPRRITVSAFSQDDTLIDKFELTVTRERVPDYISEPNDVYNIMLLPLEEKETPTDPNSRFKDPERANKAVLDALHGVRLYNPDNRGQMYNRFNCSALDNWRLKEVDKELQSLHVEDSSPETKFATLATEAKYKDDEGRSIELGFLGDIIEDANTIEIILKVVDIKNRQILFQRIDIFCSKPDYKWCTDGLISKLLRAIPRVHTGYTCEEPRSKMVKLGLGSNQGVFQNMEIGLYRQRTDGHLESLGIQTSISDVRRDTSTIKIVNQRWWNNACNIRGKAVAVSR